MIKVILKKNFDLYGKDIVCSAVSSIVITSVNAIIRLESDSISYDNSHGINISILKHNKVTDCLIENMVSLLFDLEKQYKKNIIISEEAFYMMKFLELNIQLFAHKKGQGSTKNGRDSISKRLGAKAADGEYVSGGSIIYRQRGTKIFPGNNVGIGSDDTLYAKVSGYVKFERVGKDKKQASVYPEI